MTDQNLQPDIVSSLANAHILRQQGKLAEAAALCKMVLARHPKEASTIRLLAPFDAVFEKDAEIQAMLGEAHLQLGNPLQASARFRRVAELNPDDLENRERLGTALQFCKDFEASRQEMEKILAIVPHRSGALTILGLALLNLRRFSEAEEKFRRAIAVDPENHEAALHLGMFLALTGKSREALVFLHEAAKRSSESGTVRLTLGRTLYDFGQEEEGIAQIKAATEKDPTLVVAWTQLGTIAKINEQHTESLYYFRKAMEAAQRINATPPYRAYANALWMNGAYEDAVHVMRDWMGKSFWANNQPRPRKGADHPRIVALAGMGNCNTPIKYIVENKIFDVDPLTMLDGYDYPIAHIERCFDLVFTTVSDIDSARRPIEIATSLVDRLSIPVLNHPAHMAATARHLTATALRDIPGLHIPRTERFNRLLLRDQITTALADISFPVLLRPAGSHGGKGLSKIDHPAEIAAALDALTSDDVYITEYYDFAGDDGLYRKLRMMFVDHKTYPAHLSISEDWLNHYFRTRTADEAVFRDEEARYLDDPERYLGAEIFRAMHQIAHAHKLDYFGLDGAIDRHGRLVVFECNATMLIRHLTRQNIPAKKNAAERIRAATTDLIRRTARPMAG